MAGEIGSIELSYYNKAEKALQESEEKFKILSDSLPVALIVYRDNRFLYVNQAAVLISGYTAEELLKMDLIELFHPDSRGIIKERVNSRMGGERKQANYEVKLITKSGEEKWLDVSSNLIRYEGLLAGLVICMDNPPQAGRGSC